MVALNNDHGWVGRFSQKCFHYLNQANFSILDLIPVSFRGILKNIPEGARGCESKRWVSCQQVSINKFLTRDLRNFFYHVVIVQNLLVLPVIPAVETRVFGVDELD